jgi:hypothetical protein
VSEVSGRCQSREPRRAGESVVSEAAVSEVLGDRRVGVREAAVSEVLGDRRVGVSGNNRTCRASFPAQSAI